MKNNKKYFHWIYGENILRDDNPTYIINMEIGVCIRFDYEEGFFADFKEFFEHVADVQFFYGNRPEESKVKEVLTEAWNFLCKFEEEEENRGELEEGY